MDRRDLPPLRSFPRVFLPGAEPGHSPIELPKEEYDKLHKVLRLGTGDKIAILPGDGRLIVCELEGRSAVPQSVFQPKTESPIFVTLVLGLPKPDKLEASVRMSTELGVQQFSLFPADRSVVRWDKNKFEQKLERLSSIAREAAEVSFRTMLPRFEVLDSLQQVLQHYPGALVLSEVEEVQRHLATALDRKNLPAKQNIPLVIGPEGGWSPRELEWIGDRGVTLGPRVLRVDTAAATACALTLGRP